MKTLWTKFSCRNGDSVAKRVWKVVPLAILMLQLAMCIPVLAADEDDTDSGGVLKFGHAEYMKATSSGQKKAESAIRGDLCFDTAKKKIKFRCGDSVPAFSVSYDSVRSLLYEQAAKPRYTEAVLISPVFLLTHSKKHFLTIQYMDSAGVGQFVIVHLDKKNAREAIAAAESQTGKAVERVEEK